MTIASTITTAGMATMRATLVVEGGWSTVYKKIHNIQCSTDTVQHYINVKLTCDW